MPLAPDALQLIRQNLEQLAKGERPKTITIGNLTPDQLVAINAYWEMYEFPPISGEMFFIGKHVYESRIVGDGYSIDDVLDQISSAFDPTALVINSQKMTAIKNPVKRGDRYGNWVNDEAVLECWRHNPRSQLFSVVPRGDRIKPRK
jgi:hypothetical protein